MAKTARRPSLPPKAGGSSRTPTILAIAVVVLLAVVVGGILYFRSTEARSDIAASPSSATYTTSVQNGIVVAGSGPTVLDVYEDALCPACRQFETLYGQQVTDALNANRVTVRYHMVDLLENESTPPGYSTLGGNAIICAAENNAFAALHSALYQQQPTEGGAGYTSDQLVAAGASVNAGPGYADCVRSGRYSGAVAANFAQASSDPALQQTVSGRTGFGTPTVVVSGRTVTPGSQEFLAALA